jgi:4-hydroxy 2-oxovalerate aldolase
MGTNKSSKHSINIAILDCTLRDGGYQNDWKFGYDFIRMHIVTMIEGGINFIEIGFLDKIATEDLNRCVFPSFESVARLLKGIVKENSKFLLMIDYGKFDIDSIPEHKLSLIDGFRVIAKMENALEAIEFTSILRTKGYMTFFQLVSSGEYADNQLVAIAEHVNRYKIDFLSVVDTYGQMYPSEINHIIDVLDSNLLHGVGLGFHGHNNIQLAFTNSIAAMLFEHDRPKIIDGTLLGMGKNAGNCPLELLVDYVNREIGSYYNIGLLLDLIEIKYNDLKIKYQWGYSNKFYLTATNKIHPNYVSYLMDKRTLLSSNIIDILKKIPENKKLRFDETLVNSLYLEFQSKFDKTHFTHLLDELKQYNQIDLIAPGRSLLYNTEYFNKIYTYPRVSVNFIPNFPVDYVLVTNPRRFKELFYDSYLNLQAKKGIILTNNVLTLGREFDYLISYRDNIELEALFVDNPLFIIGNFLVKHLPNITLNLIGFDGYDKAIESNYVIPDMEYSFTKDKAEKLNNDIIAYINRHRNQLKIIVPHDSKYSTR